MLACWLKNICLFTEHWWTLFPQNSIFGGTKPLCTDSVPPNINCRFPPLPASTHSIFYFHKHTCHRQTIQWIEKRPYSNSIIGYETIIANRLSIMEKIRLLHPYIKVHVPIIVVTNNRFNSNSASHRSFLAKHCWSCTWSHTHILDNSWYG